MGYTKLKLQLTWNTNIKSISFSFASSLTGTFYHKLVIIILSLTLFVGMNTCGKFLLRNLQQNPFNLLKIPSCKQVEDLYLETLNKM